MHSLLGQVLRPLQSELLRDADVRVQDPPSPHASHTEESRHSSNTIYVTPTYFASLAL